MYGHGEERSPIFEGTVFHQLFYWGLRGDIKHDVCGQNPQGLLDSFWYAKNYEKAANARKAAGTIHRNKPQYQNSGGMVRNMANKGQQKGDGEKKEEKKCWFCKEPWFPRHQCKLKKALHALLVEDDEQCDDEGDDGEITPTEETTQERVEEKQPEDTNAELMSISQSAVEGTTRPDTFAVIIKINGSNAWGWLIVAAPVHLWIRSLLLVHIVLSSVPRAKGCSCWGGELESGIQVPEMQYDIQERFSPTLSI